MTRPGKCLVGRVDRSGSGERVGRCLGDIGGRAWDTGNKWDGDKDRISKTNINVHRYRMYTE